VARHVALGLVGGLLFGIVIGMWEIAKVVWHK
jgi:hypothetical protein